MKDILQGILILVLFGALFMLLGFANKKHEKLICKSLTIEIAHDGQDKLVQEQEVKDVVKTIADSIESLPVSWIDANRIEQELLDNPYIREANAYSDLDGNFTVRIGQRVPVVRIIDEYNHKYYIDGQGNIFQNKSGKAVRVLIANGNLDNIKLPENRKILPIDSLGDPRIKGIYNLTREIRKDEFLNAQIDQIYVNQKNEFELVPKIGNHYIEFGSMNDMEDKLLRLKAFYIKGLKNKDWTQYKKISLKFKNQVVCTKK